MKRTICALGAVALLLIAQRGAAVSVEADPSKDYAIKPEAGACMICAASFTGPEAPLMAHDMVLEIRQRYNLPAYIFNRGAEERDRQQAEVDRIRRLCPEGRVRVRRIEEQFAVLVGGYKDMESARNALDGFKKCKPSEKLMSAFVSSKEATKDGQKGILTEKGYINPFLGSFVVRNPTLPAEAAPDALDDPFVRKINDGEKYSVYKCKKPFTMVVAVFQGTPMMEHPGNEGTIFSKLIGHAAGDELGASALNAQGLARALNGAKYEAYVFHTRYNSVVSVGGYEKSDDPQMAQMEAAIRKHIRVETDPRAKVLLPKFLPMPVPH